jgi:hypothetical protein
MRLGNKVCPPGITKPELRAAVDAADTWADANQASYVAAIPAAFQAAADPMQMAGLLAFVLRRRHGNLQTEED